MLKIKYYISKFIFIIILVIGIITILSLVLFIKKNDTNWKTYQNLELRYEIKYPSSWYLKDYRSSCRSKKKCLEYLYIENMEEKVIVAGGGPITENGCFFNIVIFDDYHFSSIEEKIKNGHFSSNPDIANRIKQERLKLVKFMKIGGAKRKVWRAYSAVEFIHENKFYRIHYGSTSKDKEQYKHDMNIFEKMLESFKLK